MMTRRVVTPQKVLDRDEARGFHGNPLGPEVGQDVQQGSVRRLTVRISGDPEGGRGLWTAGSRDDDG
jgi:hypothetical protein